MSDFSGSATDDTDITINYIQTKSPIVTFVYTIHSDELKLSFVSENIKEQTGYSSEQFLDGNSFLLDKVHPDDEIILSDAFSSLPELGPIKLEFRFLNSEDEYRWIMHELCLCKNESDAKAQLVGYWFDVTEKVLFRNDVKEKNKLLNAVLNQADALNRTIENVIDGVITIDEKGIIRSFNSSAEKLFGYDRRSVIGKNIDMLMPSPYKEQHDEYIQHYLKSGDAKIVGIGPREVVALHKNGKKFPLDLAISEVVVNGTRNFIGIVRDITERKTIKDKLLRLANYDALTGLPNRESIFTHIEQNLTTVNNGLENFALLYLDIDRFKLVNDSLGHAAGDLIIEEISKRLSKCADNDEMISRLGGDEFAVLIENYKDLHDIEKFSDEVIQVLQAPFVLNGRQFTLGVSIGVVLFPTHAIEINGLLKGADLAMYEAKRRGGNCYQYYSEEMSSTMNKRFKMENMLRTALQERQFIVHYQPQVDIESKEIYGVEALIRWKLPDGTLIPPLDFIPVLEETGMIIDVGDWVLEQACSEIVRWNATSKSPLMLSVNLSAVQFRDSDLVDKVKTIIDRTNFPPELLNLEITESVLMHDPSKIAIILEQIHNMGLKLSVDDFGTGYSSLTYLRKFPLDYLKLDRSFVKDIPTCEESVEITKTVISLADSLKIEMVAEGVENNLQLGFLKEQKCRRVQGFYYSEPLEYLDLITFLVA